MHHFTPNYDLYEIDWVQLRTLQKINVVLVKREKKNEFNEIRVSQVRLRNPISSIPSIKLRVSTKAIYLDERDLKDVI